MGTDEPMTTISAREVPERWLTNSTLADAFGAIEDDAGSFLPESLLG